MAGRCRPIAPSAKRSCFERRRGITKTPSKTKDEKCQDCEAGGDVDELTARPHQAARQFLGYRTEGSGQNDKARDRPVQSFGDRAVAFQRIPELHSQALVNSKSTP